MSLFVLVRHAETNMPAGILPGRIPDVHLSQEGMESARRLAGELGKFHIDAVMSGPLERAVETARPIAHACGVPMRICADLDEFDYGEWAGRRFIELARDPGWNQFNCDRMSAFVPGGESAAEAGSRVAGFLAELRAGTPGAIVMVTHAEIIRAALACCLRTPNNLFDRIEISHASLTLIEAENDYSRILMVNGLVDLGTCGMRLRQRA